MEQAAPIMQLPAEVLLQILNHLKTTDLLRTSQTSRQLYDRVTECGLPYLSLGPEDDDTGHRIWRRLGATERGLRLRQTFKQVDAEGWTEDTSYNALIPPTGDLLKTLAFEDFCLGCLQVLTLGDLFMPNGWESILVHAATSVTDLTLRNLWYDPISHRPSPQPLPSMPALRRVVLLANYRPSCGNKDATVEKMILRASRCTDLSLHNYSAEISEELVAMAGSALIKLHVDTVIAGLDNATPNLQHASFWSSEPLMPKLPDSILTSAMSVASVPAWTRYLRNPLACANLQMIQIYNYTHGQEAGDDLLCSIVEFASVLKSRRAALVDSDDVCIS